MRVTIRNGGYFPIEVLSDGSGIQSHYAIGEVEGSVKMPVKLTVKSDLDKLSTMLSRLSKERLQAAGAQAVTNVAFKARADVMARLPKMIDRPTPLTMNSVVVNRADPNSASPVARVFIRDQVSKGVAPASYLDHLAVGGQRPFKASERALGLRGYLKPSQQIVPASGAQLDAYGNITGGNMKQILARIGLPGDPSQGGRATAAASPQARNAAARRTKMLRRQGILIARKSGTDYFVARSKLTGEPIGIYRLEGPGRVVPVLWFVDRRPSYRPMFPFLMQVGQVADGELHRQMLKAVIFQLKDAGVTWSRE